MSYRIEMPIRIYNRAIARHSVRPLFDAMRNYFNDRVGREVYRHQMMDMFRGYNLKTVDTYRSYLTSAGFLIVVDRGEYHVLKEIPHGMSLADVRWEGEYRRKKARGEVRTKKMYVIKPFIEKGEFNV